MSGFKDLTGQKFGRLTVLKLLDYKTKHNKLVYECVCDCGVGVVVESGRLSTGNTKSCGCLSRDILVARNTTHGQTKHDVLTPEYMSWKAMKARCSQAKSKSAKNYISRGIKVCEEWLTFENFLADMGLKPTPKHTIERKDNNKGYYKENCVWATHREQSANRRTTKIVEYRGKSYQLVDLVELTGTKYQRVWDRLNLGWSVEDAINMRKARAHKL